MTKIATLLNEIRDRPENFCYDDVNISINISHGPYYIIHKPSGQQIWISNGFGSYSIYQPVKIDFGFLDQIRFYFAFKKWQKSNPITKEKDQWLATKLCVPIEKVSS